MILTIEAANMSDMAKKLSDIHQFMTPKTSTAPVTIEEEAEEAPPVAAKKAPAKAAPAKKEPAKPLTPTQTVSKAEVLKLLQAVSTKLGLPAAKEILAQFGCNRISELKEEQYDEFVESCSLAIA